MAGHQNKHLDEDEALPLEALSVATAVHDAGGLVVVQVERVAERGSLAPAPRQDSR